jgi:hypothetical protein
VSSEIHLERWARSLRTCCCTKLKSFTSSVKIKGKGTKVMSLHKSSLLVLSVFLFTGGIAQSQVIDGKKQVPSTDISPAKKWRVVDGFRSAKFGMNEKQVMQAILKDFKAPKKLVNRDNTSPERTPRLIVTIADLLLKGDVGQVVYTLGHKSKRLIQIDIAWGGDVSQKNLDYSLVTATASILGAHLTKKRFMRKGFIVNKTMKDKSIIVFRGQDVKGRMILLLLRNLPAKEGNKMGLSLRLSYISNVKKPDVFRN